MIVNNNPNYLLVDGNFAPGDLCIEVVKSSRILAPEVELMIEENWANLLLNPSTSHFFDGALWRYVAHEYTDNKIKIIVEPTSFRAYKGMNIDHPEFFHKYGQEAMASPLVVAAMVKTSDNYLLFPRRSQKVALFQNQIHIIGGLVSRKRDVLTGEEIFQAMQDEIIEETGVQADEIEYLKCEGLRFHLPYHNYVFAFKTGIKINASELKNRVGVDAYEHEDFIFVPDRLYELDEFVRKYRESMSLPLKCWIDHELKEQLVVF